MGLDTMANISRPLPPYNRSSVVRSVAGECGWISAESCCRFGRYSDAPEVQSPSAAQEFVKSY
jgi:hypothetical protein